MKINKKILLIIIFTLFFINYRVYAKYENEYNTDVILNDIKSNDSNYDYDIFWDDMKFIYTENKSFAYDNDTHDYVMSINEYWSHENNKVSIKNNSFSSIDVSLSYKSNDLYDNVIGTFNPSEYTIKYNEKVDSSLELDGKINDDNDEFFTIGTITIEVE